jgi:DNA-binding protein WhiA
VSPRRRSLGAWCISDARRRVQAPPPCTRGGRALTLSEDLRNELAAIAPKKGCDRLAELSALFHSAGRIHLRGRGEVSLHLDLLSNGVARRAFALLRGFGVASEIRTYRQHAFDRPTRYELHVSGDPRALQLLNEAGVLASGLTPLERPPRRIVSRACCRGAYLRGSLLGSGTLSGPRAPHLEIRTATLGAAQFIASVAEAEGLVLGVQGRPRHCAAYARGAETIAGVLAAAGAGDLVLALEERAVVGSTRARANRLANADHANLVRTSRAAFKQLEAVRQLEREDRLKTLSPPLREIAELRLLNPSLPLRELALKCRPPATKAAAHRRLRRLQQLADGRPSRSNS